MGPYESELRSRGWADDEGICAISLALCNMDQAKRLRVAVRYGKKIWVHTNSMGSRTVYASEGPEVRIEDGFGEWLGYSVESVSWIEFGSVNGSVLTCVRGEDGVWSVVCRVAPASEGRYNVLFDEVCERKEYFEVSEEFYAARAAYFSG